MSKTKEEGKEKEKVKEAIIAPALHHDELSSFDILYGNLVKEPGKSLTTEEVRKLGDQYLTSDRMLNLFSKNPEEAYKELITARKFDTGMFIKLIVYEEICSKGKFVFEHPEYLLNLVKGGSFDLQDPMLLAYAVRFSNENLALFVTNELVKKGAVIANSILFYSYNNPHVTKFLLIEKPSIITSQDKLIGTDALIKKVQGKLSTSASETDKVKLKTTLKLLEAAKIGDKDLNIKLDIICPPFFDNKASEILFEDYASAFKQFGDIGLKLYDMHIEESIKNQIKSGGNLKGVSKEFESYVRKCEYNNPEFVKAFFQDISSTTSTATTSVSTTSSLEKSFTSASFSSTSSLITLSSSTTIESISDVPLAGGDGSSTDAT